VKFSSVILSWKSHKRVCEHCLEKIKAEISKRAAEDPSVKEQADKELQAADDAKVKIGKKKSKSGEFSESDESSESEDENGEKKKKGGKLKLPGFGFNKVVFNAEFGVTFF
jgi:hypothetical protein